MSTLKNQLLEIEKEEETYKEDFSRINKIESAISKAKIIISIVSFLIVAAIVFSIHFIRTNHFICPNYIVILFLLFFIPLLGFVLIQILLEKQTKRLIYRSYKITEKEYFKISSTKSDLFHKKNNLYIRLSNQKEDVKNRITPLLETNKTTQDSLNEIIDSQSIKNKMEIIQNNNILIAEGKTVSELFNIPLETESNTRKDSGRIKISVKKDYLKLNERRHNIGETGEAFAFEWEKIRLDNLGLKKYSSNIIHISKKDDSVGYDILSFFENGKAKYIEVKTTTEDYDSSFYLTETELTAMNKLDNYFIYRIYNFNTETCKGNLFVIDCKKEIEKYYQLDPISYRVSPK